MLAQSFSQTGSIREDNQDHLLIDPELRLAIIADGHGAAGKVLAEQTAVAMHQRLREIAPVTGGDENLYRLSEAYELACQTVTSQTGNNNRCDIAAAWISRGTAAVFATGTCRLLTSLPDNNEWREQREFALPVGDGMSIILVSEGAAAALSSLQLQPALNSMLAQTDAESFTTFANQTTAVYDGDDCSAILLRLDSSDLTAGTPHELELFEHYNRSYSCKLWVPLSLAGCVGLAALATASKLKPLLNRIKN